MPYALVTGAAKGIGRGIAAELARRNYNLLLVDIDKPGLLSTSNILTRNFNIVVHTLEQDLTEPDAGEKLFAWSSFWHHDLTVVVNNAGYGLNSIFEEEALDHHLNIIDLIIKAQVSLSYLYIPVLRTHAKSYLLNVGSTTAYQSIPYLNIYAASKAFVHSFTRSLRFELRHSPVSVSCLVPGSTDTDFVNRANMGASVKKMAERFNMNAEEVGRIAVSGLLKGKAMIIPGFNNKLHAYFTRFVPKIVVEKIGAGIYAPESVSPIIKESIA